MSEQFAEFVLNSASATSAEASTPDLLPVIALCRRIAQTAIAKEITPFARVKAQLGRRIFRWDDAQDVDRHRLSDACVAAISGSNRPAQSQT
jgi:hypothetical protein